MTDRLEEIEQHVEEHVADGDTACTRGIEHEQWLIAEVKRLRYELAHEIWVSHLDTCWAGNGCVCDGWQEPQPTDDSFPQLEK